MNTIKYKNYTIEDIQKIIKEHQPQYVQLDNEKIMFWKKTSFLQGVFSNADHVSVFPRDSERLLSINISEGINNKSISNLLPIDQINHYLLHNDNLNNLYNDNKNSITTVNQNFEADNNSYNLETVKSESNKDEIVLVIEKNNGKIQVIKEKFMGYGHGGSFFTNEIFDFKNEKWTPTSNLSLFNEKNPINLNFISKVRQKHIEKMKEITSFSLKTGLNDIRKYEEIQKDTSYDRLLQLQKGLIFSDDSFIKNEDDIQFFNDSNEKYKGTIKDNIDEIMKQAKKNIIESYKKTSKKKKSGIGCSKNG
jgi:predicted HicB family RNase H-like nuclease